MATEKRLIYLDDIKDALRSVSEDTTCPVHIAAEIDQIVELAPTVDAVEVDKINIRLHHILIDNEGVPEVKLQIGDRYFILHTDPVDVAEVVRCKDCKFRKSTFSGEGYFCSVWDTDDYEEAYVKHNDFCSYGERRTDENR